MAASDSESAERELVITRLFDAPRDVVFQAWTEPERLIEWWGPKGFTTPSFELDLRPGGAWRAHMRSQEGKDYIHYGVLREIVPPERLVLTFVWEDDPDHEMLVTVTFAERDGRTEMTLRQGPFKAADERTSHEEGWAESLDYLAAYLAKN